ncbi:MAG: preprotein translocase subunit YajC [Nevskia sp.]
MLEQVLDFLIPVAQAQSGTPSAQSLLGATWPLFVLVPLFYFMLIRPQMKRGKEAREMMAKLAKGDEAVTSGGLAGRITTIGENYVSLEIADKVEVKVQKAAITSVLPKGTLKNL